MSTQEIRTVSFFDDDPRARWAELGMLADRITVPAGHMLVEQGALAHDFFVIIDGTVEVIRDGEFVTVLGPGDFFGEIALCGDPHRTATVVAVSEVDLTVVGRRDFRTMLARFPEIASSILLTASRRLAASRLAAPGDVHPSPDRWKASLGSTRS